MWRFKGCPKCRGDVYLERDFDGAWYEHCLQCGYRRYMPEVAATGRFVESDRFRASDPLGHFRPGSPESGDTALNSSSTRGVE